jgi:class 3 adenylate cyclase
MRAWTVDADDIRVAEDFDESLLHRTPEIESFLSLDRDDKFIVVATKGFGKTLLLKAKRILYQRDGRATCLPVGNLLDKPIGDKVFGKEALALLAASPLPWSKLWLTAVAVATLKHLGKLDALTVHRKLAGLIADDGLRGVIDHLVRLLDFSPSDLQRCATDVDGHLVPRLRAVNSPVAIFIDGVDEYFHKHIESRPSHPSVTGQLSPNVWYFAQLGLVQVAYELRRINHHLKIFAAVRKEAFARLQTAVMSQQYQGSAIDIVYPIESLREIFVNNIRLDKSDKMVLPGRLRPDPVEAFLGRTKVLHIYTGEHEDAFAYVGRNTLLRPRDLMTVGERLTALRPEERRNENRLKDTVNRAATEIAHEYLTEIAPYLGDLELERCFRRLPRPILTREDVETLFREHNADLGALEQHVFCALYRVGLLGYLHHDWVRGEWVQRFLRPGEGTLEPDGVLPPATHYFVHPVLSDVIGRLNPSYLQHVDRINIVGYGRPWRLRPSVDSAATARMLCVLTGDVHGFGELMRARVDVPVRHALEEAVRKWAHEAVAAETRAGDAVWVVHDDPVALAQIARHMIDEVYRAPGQPRLRIALHYGEVQTRRQASDGSLAIAGGDAVLCAARIEPHVHPGQIWASEEFRQQLALTPSLWRTTPVPGQGDDERLNVKKATEPDLWVRLYRLEF